MNNPYEGLTFFDSPDKHASEVYESPQSSHANQQREYGRWNIQECQVYLEVLRNCEEWEIIKQLKRALPTRIESQIRAHHVKMMRKYGTVERILLISDRKENKQLLQLNSRISNCLTKLTHLNSLLPNTPKSDSQIESKP